jgi:hypothetical protein
LERDNDDNLFIGLPRNPDLMAAASLSESF